MEWCQREKTKKVWLETVNGHRPSLTCPPPTFCTQGLERYGLRCRTSPLNLHGCTVLVNAHVRKHLSAAFGERWSGGTGLATRWWSTHTYGFLAFGRRTHTLLFKGGGLHSKVAHIRLQRYGSRCRTSLGQRNVRKHLPAGGDERWNGVSGLATRWRSTNTYVFFAFARRTMVVNTHERPLWFRTSYTYNHLYTRKSYIFNKEEGTRR